MPIVDVTDLIEIGTDPHILRPSNAILPDLAHQRELIDAAIAVNEAPTLGEAFQILADTGAALLGCERLTVVAWNNEVTVGTICADTGSSVGKLVSATTFAAEKIRTEPVYSGPPQVTPFSTSLDGSPEPFAFVVRVSLGTVNGVATFHAYWREPLGDDEATDAAELVQTLTRLTSIAERSLREGEQLRLSSVLDRVADGVVVSKGTTATPNAAARALLAIPEGVEFRTELLNPRNLDGEPYELPADQVTGAKSMANGDGESRRFRIRVTALDGRELVLDGSISPAPDGAIVVFRDVTAEHEREVLNERYLYALFNSIPVPLTVGDASSHQLISANRAFLDLIGFELDEIVGTTPPFPWWDPREETKEGVVAGSVLRRVFRRKDGRPLPAEVLYHGVPGDNGDSVLLLGVITDLSEQRRLDQQLVQSGKLAAIGELAAGVAHEINNPLFAILGLTEFLLNEIEPGSKPYQRLELIQQTGLEIKEIVRALLDFARENADERHVVALDDVVRSTVDLIRRTNAHKGVEVIDSYNDDGALVNASPNQLKQIVLNLMANARQAMPNGGTVSVGVYRDDQHVIAVVSDDGPGIEPTVLERIFDPFFTTKRLTGGTGLGLSVSLGIAESHGGTLTAASKLGEGSAFTLRLPIAKDTLK
jgi:PAS domain S-box-containing protein